MNKKEEKILFDGLQVCFEYMEEIYKLSSFTKEYCDLKDDSDDLYKISKIVNIISKIANEASLSLYRLSCLNPEKESAYDSTLKNIFKQ